MSTKSATKRVTKKETQKPEETKEQQVKAVDTHPTKAVKKSVKKATVEPVVETSKPTKSVKSAKTVKSTKAIKTDKSTKSAKSTKSSKSTKSAKTPKATKGGKALKPAKKDVSVEKSVPVTDDGTKVNEDDDTKTRFFKVIVDGGEAHGRFSGTKPKQAANKALTSILKSKKQSGGSVSGKIKFSIVECTRNSKHKTYNYVGERLVLDNPIDVKIYKGTDKEKVIPYKFNNRVMKDKEVVAQA